MLNINPRSSTPIYEQIQLGIKELIIRGALKNGDKMPSVRQLSSILTINPNTISKAYGELEKEGIIEKVRGKGTFVTDNYRESINEKKVEYVFKELKKIILEAKCGGISEELFVKIVTEIFFELKGN